jgi:hypothetical protein
MPIDFYYKGLSAEERIHPYRPSESVDKAKGTLYESWFDTLKASPWYAEICDTKKFPTDSSKETWQRFGDLRNVTFENWWLIRGHKIFSEKTPYRPINEVTLDYAIENRNDINKPPVLVLEIPLNLTPAELTKQFEKIVARQILYMNEMLDGTPTDQATEHSDNDMFAAARKFNRWDHSTAAAHQQRETKMTYQQIKVWVDAYKGWIAAKTKNPKLTQSQYAQQLKLKPKGVRDLGAGVALGKEEKDSYANALSEYLKMAKFLMAHAADGVFPCTDPHSWVEQKARKKTKPS